MELQRYVGEKIKEFRLKRGLSQEELAELLETTKQTVSRYENGDRKANQDILFQLSTIFNVSIDDFFPSRNTILTVAERKTEFKVDNMKSYNYFPVSDFSVGLEEKSLIIDGIFESYQNENNLLELTGAILDLLKNKDYINRVDIIWRIVEYNNEPFYPLMIISLSIDEINRIDIKKDYNNIPDIAELYLYDEYKNMMDFNND